MRKACVREEGGNLGGHGEFSNEVVLDQRFGKLLDIC